MYPSSCRFLGISTPRSYVRVFLAEIQRAPVAGVLRDHLAILEAARQRAALLRARSGQTASTSGSSAPEARSAPQISGVLRDYLATKQAALAHQLESSPSQPTAEPGSGSSDKELSSAPQTGPSTGVLKDYLATLRARQRGSHQQSQPGQASPAQIPTGGAPRLGHAHSETKEYKHCHGGLASAFCQALGQIL